MWRYSFIYLLLAIGDLLWSQEAMGKTPLSQVNRDFFIENKGQWHPDVLYLYQGPSLEAWITRYGLNLTFVKWEERKEYYEIILVRHQLLLKLEGANPQPAHEGRDKKPGHFNYLITNDPSKHVKYVGLYGEVWIKEVYPGISLRYYSEEGRLRYEYVVAPGADPAQIRFQLRGADWIQLKSQRLILGTRLGQVELCKLQAYQEDRSVPVEFVVEGGSYRIAVGAYDRKKPLIIDPLVYSTFIGNSSDNVGRSVALDTKGHIYVVGRTQIVNYEVAPGVSQVTYEKSKWEEILYPDAFVVKLSSTGNAMEYFTYIGGTEKDFAYDIAVDREGQAYVTGVTHSSDYPVTAGAFQRAHGGAKDVFVTKLSADGSELVYSTYLGGKEDDEGLGIAVDEKGQVYITGSTKSSNYPVTPSAFRTTSKGASDVFVTKLSTDGERLVYSTYIGGSRSDGGHDIVIDENGQAYITGWTWSPDYDVTSKAFQRIGGGHFSDVFVTKLSADGSALIYSTYLGGSHNDIGYGIAVDDRGQVYVTGCSWSDDYDLTPEPFQSRPGGGSGAFVTKLNAEGSMLLYSTYLGGWGDDRGHGIVVDDSGYAYVTGSTRSADYPVTPGAFRRVHSGEQDVFVTKLNKDGRAVVYSTYLGGSQNDIGYGIVVDKEGRVWVVGATASTEYDVTPGALQTALKGGYDIFLTKLCMDAIAVPKIVLISAASTHNQTTTVGVPIESITYAVSNAANVDVINLPVGITASFDRGTGRLTISGMPSRVGTFKYIVAATGCGIAVAKGTITVKSSL